MSLQTAVENELIRLKNKDMNYGYHKKEIVKGVYGEYSKIREEVYELQDACEQENRLMQLIELSDLVCAIEGFLSKKFNNSIKIEDLIKQSKATIRAFEIGERK